MTISVPGVDNGFTYGGLGRCPTLAWASFDQQSEAGRVAITIHNHSARFHERLMERLVLQTFAAEISGEVHETGVAVARRVRVYRRSDGQFVGETVSDPTTGEYTIAGMRPGVAYFLVAFDDLETDPNFNAIALDQVVP